MLAEAVVALRTNAVETIVLKGAPLAQWLYGDYTVRPSVDLDLFVPEGSREAARTVLADIGWRWTTGNAPEEETFEYVDGARLFRMEVHSSALDDALLNHVAFPVEHRDQQIGRHVLPMHGGRFLPAYLATHLAKHSEKPLLWAVDFFMLWNRLQRVEQEEAIAAAADVRLERYLLWAVSLIQEMDVVRFDDADCSAAARSLTRRLAPRGDMGRLIDLVALSDTPSAAASVVAGRIWPSARGRDWRQAPRYFWRRAVRWCYRRVVFEQPAPNVDSTEKISLADRDSGRRLVDALRDAPAWVAPADGSMEPAIPVFAAAHILPVDRSAIGVGDVVLVQSAPGRCALNRVTGLDAADVRLTADAALDSERVVPQSAVIGVCDLVDVGGSRIPIRERPRGSLGMLRAILRSRIKRRVPVARSDGRFFYALDLDSAKPPIAASSPPVEFHESSPADRLDRDALETTIDSSLASGQVVGLLKGQTVYRVSYVRGAGAELRALPDGFQPRDRVVLLHDGYTEPEFRNRGIHAAALRWLIDRERSAGVEQAVCVVRADNLIARRAVEKLGFRCVGPVD